jgi:hypothetical protein
MNGNGSAARVNTASRLAMLAERMAKLNAQVGRDILLARSRRALGETSAEFERALQGVGAGATTAELRENNRLLRVLWDEFRPIALQAPDEKTGRKLAERTEELSWIAAKGARLLQELNRSRAADLVILAGTARAAAQRLGKLHLQRGWALSANALPRDTTRAEGEVVHAIEALRAAPETHEDAALALGMAESQLVFLRQAVERLAQGKDRPLQLEHIAKSSDHVAETLDRVAKACEEVKG